MFPSRIDQISSEELSHFREKIRLLKRLFENYDLVQCYATDPILPLLADFHPNVAFEHGTLRDFTVGNTPICRATAISYRAAGHTFITNGDCLDYALRLGIKNYSPMIHPLDDDKIVNLAGDKAGLRKSLGVKYAFLCTLRHDWQVKGTDKYIRAIPMIRKEIGDDFKIIMTEWGSDLSESQQLAKSLGVEKFIEWVAPLGRQNLLKLIKSVDAVFDQIALPHFGATAPEAIAAGTPVLMSYLPASTSWLVSEPAPIIPAFDAPTIASGVARALTPDYRDSFMRDSKRWIAKCHSAERLVETHIGVYRNLIEKLNSERKEQDLNGTQSRPRA
jgi:glycosyltransferase involved in cell wall biosynthesis